MNDPRVRLGPDRLGVEAERVLGALDAMRPVVHLGNALGETAAAAAAALIGMLGRLFPHTAVEGCAEMGPNPWGTSTINAFIDACAPTRPKASCSPSVDIVIGVGSASTEATLALGGDDWTACLGSGPQTISTGRLGLGLQMAAALLVSEAVKRALGPLGVAHNPLNGQLVWNLIDYQHRSAPGLIHHDVGALRVALFGAGSVGSSIAAVLCCASEVRGVIDVVDADTFDPIKNPFRYPAATGAEAGSKATWLDGMLRRAGWEVIPFCGTVAEWLAKQDEPGYNGIAVSSVDGVEGRLQVADVLARTTLSVGVAGLALHMQREVLGDGWACPFCDFVDAAPALSQAQVWAAQSGLSVQRIAQLIVGDQRLTLSDVEAVVQAGRLHPERAAELIGRRLVDLIGRAYAEMAMSAQHAPQAMVTAPHVSWVGGVLAAAELAKAALGLPLVDRRIDIDLSGLPTGFTLRRKADSSGRCLCASPIRRRWMKRMHGDE